MFYNLKKLTKKHKNKKILFYFMSLLTIFFITDRVDALTFDVNGTETEVTKENCIYYMYTIKPEIFNYYHFLVYSNTSTSSSICTFVYSDTQVRAGGDYLTTSSVRISGPGTVYLFSLNNDGTLTTVSNKSVNSGFSGGLSISNMESLLYTSLDYYDIMKTKKLLSSNITIEQIEEYFGKKPIYTITYYVNNEVYQTIEVEEGTSHNLLDYSYNSDTHIFSGWQYDETLDFTNITSDIIINSTLEKKDVIPVYIEFPINKNEFYTLLVEVGVLIMIIFLKWCFPFKGGSDLK